MQDTIILGNGTSKQIKTASLPDSYAEFKAMAESGNIFADISLNADGCEVVGTPLNKLNLLTDETASNFGNAVNIDEAFLNAYNQILNLIPIGTVVATARSSAPSKWLLCQGQAVSRTTYSKLYSAIGTTYGTGNGSTTFNLPDLRYRVPIGPVSDTGTVYSQSSSSAKYLRITPAPELSAYGANDTITFSGKTRTISAVTVTANYIQFDLTATVGSTVNAGTSVTFNKKIGSTGGSKTHTLTVNEMPSHSHTSIAYTGGSRGSPTEAGYDNEVGSGTTGTTGGGQAHNIMQPYIVMNYIIYAGV